MNETTVTRAPRRASSARPSLADERARLRAGLSLALPEIPARYFYDDRGSALFEQITQLSVYYPTRTEISILERRALEIIELTRPREIVELGSGAGHKIRLLLDAWRTASGGPRRAGLCRMLDVNELFLEQSIAALRADYPEVDFSGTVGDFTTDLDRLGHGDGRLTVFLAGTVGNLDPDERRAFFAKLARQMGGSDALLLGVDLVKDRARLEAAYDDPEGVTAAFNLNALRVLNARFDADFDPGSFSHRAFYDAENAWIEMRLRAEKAMRVRVGAIDLTLDLAHGAEIRTELSCKFTRASLEASASAGDLRVTQWFTDPERLFALAILRRAGSGSDSAGGGGG